MGPRASSPLVMKQAAKMAALLTAKRYPSNNALNNASAKYAPAGHSFIWRAQLALFISHGALKQCVSGKQEL